MKAGCSAYIHFMKDTFYQIGNTRPVEVVCSELVLLLYVDEEGKTKWVLKKITCKYHDELKLRTISDPPFDRVKEMTISHSEESTFESIELMLLSMARLSNPVVKFILCDVDMSEDFIKFSPFNVDEISMENSTLENVDLIEIIAQDQRQISKLTTVQFDVEFYERLLQNLFIDHLTFITSDVTIAFKNEPLVDCIIEMQDQWIAPEFINSWVKEEKGT